MSIVKKKICLVGDFAVGKTSLTQQYINHVFSDKYLTTIGVKIDTKLVKIDDEQECKLLVWDVAGRDPLTPFQTSYLTGSSGFILVLDGTRRESIDSAQFLVDSAQEKLKGVPFIVLVNKSDLSDEWVFCDEDEAAFKKLGWEWLLSSAKTGVNVEEAFSDLVNKMLSGKT